MRRAGQVGQKEDGALEHAHEHEVFALVVGRDARAELGDLRAQLVAAYQGVADRVDHVASVACSKM